MQSTDEKYMKEAIKQAKKAYAIGEVPIGCVIVYQDKIIGRGYNRRTIDNNTLAHAELAAIRKASRKMNDWRLEDCTMYVTLEPCQMCSGAIVQSRMTRVKGFLTSLAGGGRLSSPEFFAPNGYAVRVIFEQSHKVTKPYILNHEVPNYINNGPGEITDFTEYEFIVNILDSKPFTMLLPNKSHIKKIEIFINPVPSLEISDTDFEADAKIKEYDQTAVHFKLKRSFVADDTWYTICLPFNVAKEQLVEVFGGKKVELRTFDHMEDGTVMYFKHVDDLAAGVPYLIKPNKTLDNLLFENVKIDMAAHPDLQVGADGYFMKGTYQATELNPDGTNLFLGDNNTFFRPSENDHRMKGTRVYFIIPRKAVGKVLSYDTETIVDGIVDVEVDSQSNSQKVYNINGVYVGDNLRNLTPGVYIVSGKKVVVTNR